MNQGPQIIRLVVTHEDADLPYGQEVLDEALDQISDKKSIVVTPGGLIHIQLRDLQISDVSWQSNPADCRKLFQATSDVILGKLLTSKLVERLRQRVGILTIGVDIYEPRVDFPIAELVVVYDAQSNSIQAITGKSYPTTFEESRLFLIKDYQSHFMNLLGVKTLVLGCHDLNIFNPRSASNRSANSHRAVIAEKMATLCKTEMPGIVIQHPHSTDTPNIWRNAWLGVRQQLPFARSYCSGIRYVNPLGKPRGTLQAVLESTKSADVRDIVIKV